jgi:Glyoxalase-like domain
VTSKFTELVVDCHDPKAVAEFWCEVLGYRIIDEDPTGVAIAGLDSETMREMAGPIPPTIVFVPVPEGKTVKNRLHIDVNPADRDQDEEVARLEALGARRVDVGQGPDVSWVVLADVEGNEFCVLRGRVPA